MKFFLMLSEADIANIRRACLIAKNMDLKHAEESNLGHSWHLESAQHYQDILDAFDSYFVDKYDPDSFYYLQQFTCKEPKEH